LSQLNENLEFEGGPSDENYRKRVQGEQSKVKVPSQKAANLIDEIKARIQANEKGGVEGVKADLQVLAK